MVNTICLNRRPCKKRGRKVIEQSGLNEESSHFTVASYQIVTHLCFCRCEWLQYLYSVILYHFNCSWEEKQKSSLPLRRSGASFLHYRSLDPVTKSYTASNLKRTWEFHLTFHDLLLPCSQHKLKIILVLTYKNSEHWRQKTFCLLLYWIIKTEFWANTFSFYILR